MRCLVLSLLVVLALPASAQRWGRSSDRVADRGAVALTFTAEDVWGGFDNGGVGLRAWLGDRLVGSASLGFSLERTDNEFASDVERAEAAVSLGLEAHVGGSRTVSPFVGGGVRLGYAEVEGSYDPRLDVWCGPTMSCYFPGSSADELSVGAGIDLGAEVRLARGVTLLGAHRLGATFVSGDVENDWVYYAYPEAGVDLGYPPPNADYTRWRVGTGETRVALSVYF